MTIERRSEVVGERETDFDHHSPALTENPFGTYADLRERCPVARSPHHGGFWVLSTYRDVQRATLDADTFRSGPNVTIPPISPRPQIPIEQDPPKVQQYRKILTSALSPAAMAELEPMIEATVSGLIDGFVESGRCDFIGDLAKPTAAMTILRLLGFDPAAWREFAEHGDRILHEFTTNPNEAIQSALWCYQQS